MPFPVFLPWRDVVHFLKNYLFPPVFQGARGELWPSSPTAAAACALLPKGYGKKTSWSPTSGCISICSKTVTTCFQKTERRVDIAGVSLHLCRCPKGSKRCSLLVGRMSIGMRVTERAALGWAVCSVTVFRIKGNSPPGECPVLASEPWHR